MKDEKEIFTQSAGVFSLAAVIDARVKNAAGKSHFPDKFVRRVGRVEMVIDQFYHFDGEVETNYRPGKADAVGNHNNKFIALKLSNPQVKDKKALAAYETALDSDPDFKKVEKRINKVSNATIYRFYPK